MESIGLRLTLGNALPTTKGITAASGWEARRDEGEPRFYYSDRVPLLPAWAEAACTVNVSF
mgnify:CR=1 FL=1